MGPRAYKYDAIVIYLPQPKDEEVVDMICDKLQRSEGGARLLIPYRDMPEHAQNLSVLKELIDKRCRRCIAIISEASRADPFTMAVVNFGINISAGYKISLMIPVLIERCLIPRAMATLTICDFTKPDMMPWALRRLQRAIKTNPSPPAQPRWLNAECPESVEMKSVLDSESRANLSRLYGFLQHSPKMKYLHWHDLS